MKQYLNLLETILTEGYKTGDRTGVGTTALPGFAYKCELSKTEDGIIHNYPLLTTKKVFLRGTFEELMWKLRGETNIQSLVKKNVHIWNEWPFKKWLRETKQWETFPIFVDDQKSDYTDEWKAKMEEYKILIIDDDDFAKEYGELGSTYGHNFRRFGEVKDGSKIVRQGKDQLMITLDKIMNNPEDRRNIISLWDPHANDESLLPPCPCFYQFFANEKGYLHLNMYQRSCDTFLGVPFNTAQDSLMLILIAHVTERNPKIFNHFFGDAHIYNNHQDQVHLQLEREPRQLPSLRINKVTSNIFDITFEDLELIDYKPMPVIKAPVAV